MRDIGHGKYGTNGTLTHCLTDGPNGTSPRPWCPVVGSVHGHHMWGYCDCTAAPTAGGTVAPTAAPTAGVENPGFFTDEIVIGLGGGGALLVALAAVCCFRLKRRKGAEYIRMGDMMPNDVDLISGEFGEEDDDAMQTDIFIDGPGEQSLGGALAYEDDLDLDPDALRGGRVN